MSRTLRLIGALCGIGMPFLVCILLVRVGFMDGDVLVAGFVLAILAGVVVKELIALVTHLIGMKRRSPTAWAVTSWAARLAGKERDMLGQWRAHLVGDPEAGMVPTPGQQRLAAAGFLIAALQMRRSDVTAPLLALVDWLLSSEKRTNCAIAMVVAGQAVYIVGDGGIPALMTEVWEPCGALGGGLYVLARWLRRVRGIALAPVRPPSSPEG